MKYANSLGCKRDLDFRLILFYLIFLSCFTESLPYVGLQTVSFMLHFLLEFLAIREFMRASAEKCLVF